MTTKSATREYWQPDAETLPPEQLEQLQGIRLRNTVERVYNNAPFYRKKLKELSVTPANIVKPRDVTKLPFTKKTDLRDHFPFGLFAVPRDEVVRCTRRAGRAEPRPLSATPHEISAIGPP